MKLDLHSHSTLSYDGGLKKDEYDSVFSEKLDCLAITDHNEVSFAIDMKKKYGSKVIVGEEVMTEDGEVIGLFLDKRIDPSMSLERTLHAISEQKGLVYIPHPFDIRRHGISEKLLLQYIQAIDIFETFNARSIYGSNALASAFAKAHKLTTIASGSDSHSFRELGRTYMEVEGTYTKQTFLSKIASAVHINKLVTPLGFVQPAYNKLNKKLNQ